jgi:cbb3-type cytochrome oxidase maturation protein
MSTIYMMIPVTLLIAGGFLVAYIWSVRSGQFEDTTTPAMRILTDDKPVSVETTDFELKPKNKKS